MKEPDERVRSHGVLQSLGNVDPTRRSAGIPRPALAISRKGRAMSQPENELTGLIAKWRKRSVTNSYRYKYAETALRECADELEDAFASRAPDKENEEAMNDQEPLTSEQVLAEVDEYCATKGNPLLAPAMRQAFEKDKRMPHAVLVSLNLEPVMMWRRKS